MKSAPTGANLGLPSILRRFARRALCVPTRLKLAGRSVAQAMSSKVESRHTYAYWSRSSRLTSFPVGVLGSSATKSIRRGTL